MHKPINGSQLMDEVFSKQRSNSQLVQRSEKLLCLLMALEQLKEEDRQLIWKVTEMNDQEMRTDMLKALQGSAADMKYSDRKFLLDRLVGLEQAAISDRHIELVKEICSTGRDCSRADEVAEVGLEFMWKMAFEK